MNMQEKIKWEDVTTVDDVFRYVRETIGEENAYEELYEDLMHGMIHNREQKKKQEKLNKQISNLEGLVLPNGK
jgi:hypothetical protein